MTVEELIVILKKYDRKAVVKIRYSYYVKLSELTGGTDSEIRNLEPDAIFQLEKEDQVILAADLCDEEY